MYSTIQRPHIPLRVRLYDAANFKMMYFDEELSDVLSCCEFRSATTTNPKVTKRV